MKVPFLLRRGPGVLSFVLWFVLAGLAGHSVARAQSPIVVTGARVPTPVDRLAADVVLIDAERIAASSADSLEDLLRREAGVQLSRSGGPGAAASVLIRGANGGHTLVLVDGVRVGSATLGLAEFEGLSLAHIERVEVLRGPGSSLYGADAVGGVVQIFTRRADDGWQARAMLAAGGLGAREASAGTSWNNGGIDLALSAADERLAGVSALRPGDRFGNYNPDADGFHRRSAALRAGVHLSPLQRLSLQATASRLDAQYDASEFLPPNYAQDNRPDFRNRLEQFSAGLEHQARWSADWRTELRLQRQSSDSLSGGGQRDHIRTDRSQQEAQVTWVPDGRHQLTLALDNAEELARTTNFVADVKRRNSGVALAWAAALDVLSLQAELRRDDNSQFGGVTTGRLGISWPLSPRLRLRGLVGSTFRAVSLNDLYYPGYGVATLRPERGRSAELGLHWRADAAGSATLDATAFHNAVRDLVSYEPDRRFCPADPAYDFGCARNVGQARLQGGTLAGQARWGAFSARVGLEWLDAKDRATGQRLIRRAAHQERLLLTWREGAWTLSADVLHLGARPEAGKMLAAATTLDLSARWAFAPNWTAQLQLRNATDRDVEPARDFKALPRQAWFALRWEMN